MKRILLKIAYDGTNFKGWQNGKNSRSVEETINNTLTELLKEKIKIFGVSRTDSGVHANCNYATFDTNIDIVPDKIYFAINDLLPRDISILESKEVSMDFDVKHHDFIKTYIYRIHNAKIRNPLKEHNAYFCYYDIDLNKLKEAAKYLIGKHNFISFINPNSQTLTNAKERGQNLDELTIREIYDIEIKKIDDIIEIKYIGSGFMYQMVRIMTGTILKAGMNMIKPIDIIDIMNKKNRKFAGLTLPGHGLTLENIEFRE